MYFKHILRPLGIYYRLESSSISVLGLPTYNKLKIYYDRTQRGNRVVAIITGVIPKSAKINHIFAWGGEFGSPRGYPE